MTAYPHVKMLIAGEWIAEGGEGAMPIINPANEQKIGSAPKVSKEQLDAALAAADAAFGVWSNTPAIERYRVIRRIGRIGRCGLWRMEQHASDRTLPRDPPRC